MRIEDRSSFGLLDIRAPPCCSPMIRVSIQQQKINKRQVAAERLLETLRRCSGWHERHMTYYIALGRAKTAIRARYLKEYIQHRMGPDELLEGLWSGEAALPIIALPNGALRCSRQTTLFEFFKTCRKVVLREICTSNTRCHEPEGLLHSCPGIVMLCL